MGLHNWSCGHDRRRRDFKYSSRQTSTACWTSRSLTVLKEDLMVLRCVRPGLACTPTSHHSTAQPLSPPSDLTRRVVLAARPLPSPANYPVVFIPSILLELCASASRRCKASKLCANTTSCASPAECHGSSIEPLTTRLSRLAENLRSSIAIETGQRWFFHRLRRLQGPHRTQEDRPPRLRLGINPRLA
jgi:hypothetical protein